MSLKRFKALLAAVLTVSSVCLTMPSATAASAQDVDESIAIQHIEYLRKLYARATDLIGSNDPANIEAGREIYHRIFTPDAKITTRDQGEIGFSATGPDQWVDVVVGALKVFDATQHLIGTQLVTIGNLPDKDGNGGTATMTSYLQAWHSDPDRVLDIFIGTYHDQVRYTAGIGWQIYAMELEKVSGEITAKE